MGFGARSPSGLPIELNRVASHTVELPDGDVRPFEQVRLRREADIRRPLSSISPRSTPAHSEAPTRRRRGNRAGPHQVVGLLVAERDEREDQDGGAAAEGDSADDQHLREPGASGVSAPGMTHVRSAAAPGEGDEARASATPLLPPLVGAQYTRLRPCTTPSWFRASACHSYSCRMPFRAYLCGRRKRPQVRRTCFRDM